ncbi:MAG: hypothetical protein JSR43_08810 [Proteobacteria bacterium]|nr:hypothetical protein [Pseudomonadota bacterium]
MASCRVAPTAALATALLLACAAALDWREVQPEGTDAVALFPCRPHTLERSVVLAGRTVPMSLHACSAGGRTWALAVAPLGDPTLVSAALEAMRRAAAANVGAATGSRRLPLDVRGATPNAASGREELRGRLPDARTVVEQLAVFTRGTTVYQATVFGAALPAEDADTFFASLRVGT